MGSKNSFVCKVPVFTVPSYKDLIKERGINYVLDLFIEVCSIKKCRFIGLNFDHGYVFALLGFEYGSILKKKKRNTGGELRQGDLSRKSHY